MPWYAALLIAITATAIGYGIDAGHKELTHVFAGFYIVGCLAAVLAVRQDGLFTAIIQPPLILFCAVPGAYWLFHGRKVGHLKDILINCGYPLIERFPLMLGTAGAVLLVGLARWYLGGSHPMAAAADESDDAAAGTDVRSAVSGFVAKLQAMLGAGPDEDADEAPPAEPRRSRTAGSSSRERRTERGGRPATRSSRTRSRHTRPPLDDAPEATERHGRRRPTGRDYDSGEPSRRSRPRPRYEGDPDLRGQPPREGRREPRPRRSPYERPVPRSGRFDGYDMYDPPGAPGRFGRYDTYERYDRHEPTFEPRRRRPESNGANPTHHPISQVRYRGDSAADEARADPRSGRRSRSQSQGWPSGEPWEYDAQE